MTSGPGLSIAAVADTPDGPAALIRDPRHPDGLVLAVNGFAQSYVDLSDPSEVVFDYLGWATAVLDGMAPAGEPIRVLHAGGGAMTLARYVAATRPGSHQQVVEANRPLHDLVAAHLPLPSGADITVRIGDAAERIGDFDTDDFDLVINDAYHGRHMADGVTGTGFAEQAARVTRPDGVYLANIANDPDFGQTKRQLGLMSTVFADLCLVAAHTEVAQRRFLNALTAATNRPAGFPRDAVAAAADRHGLELPLLAGLGLDRFRAGR